MHEFDPLGKQELLAEELTPDEVRELLERLSAADFGGSENATVGGIVEATGADATTVGKLLIQIRQERLGNLIEKHEERIDALEQSTKQFVEYPRPRTIRSVDRPFNYPITGVDPMSEDEIRRGGRHRSLIVAATILILLVVVFVESCAK